MSSLSNPARNRHPHQLTFWDIFRSDLSPVFDLICALLPPPDLFTLRRVCRRLNAEFLQTIRPTQWNITRLLRRFVNHPNELRKLMVEHDALIAGGLATQFLERVTWSESDMDVYVNCGSDSVPPAEDIFDVYLTKMEGYAMKERNPDRADSNEEIYVRNEGKASLRSAM